MQEPITEGLGLRKKNNKTNGNFLEGGEGELLESAGRIES